jgi:hypothetical protein
VGQIMHPILRRFFLSSGTQLKSGATQSLQNDHDPASDAAVSKGGSSRQTMARERQSGLGTITGALSKAAAEGRGRRRSSAGIRFLRRISTLLENADRPPCLVSVIKREGNKYFLVTPVEKYRRALAG